MRNDKGQRLYEISVLTVKLLIFVMMALSTFVFIYYGLINKSDPIINEPVKSIEKWDVKNEKNNDQIITSTMPKEVKSGEYLYFDTRRDVLIYINGELRKDFDDERDINIPGGSIKRFLMEIPLKDSDSGAKIVIERKSVLEFDKEVPEVFVTTRSGAVSHMFKTGGLSFILSFIVLIFSFVSFVVSIVLKLVMKERIYMMYGALGIFTIAAWLITDSLMFPFIFKVNHVNSLLSFLFCLMIPLGLAVYLFTIQRGRYKKSMAVILIVSVINALIWPILHFTGLMSYYDMVDYANAFLVFLAVSGIAILILDAFRGNTVSYHYTFIGFMGFLVGCLIELFNVIFELKFFKETLLIVVGLAFLLTFIVIQQVHDLRKMNLEKQKAIDISDAKTRFLASMSHEIRTPINAILGMNEMILRENNDKEIESYSRSIKSSGNMLLMLVNDVLDFTKIEAGKLEIKDSDFLMSDMLYDVVSLIGERAEEKGLELKTEITDEVPNEIISDEFRIRQVIVNFMNNAVKYTDKGSIIFKIGGNYTEDGYNLKLSVKDTGKGIRKEDKEHLFEAFSRADVKSNMSIEGTGLGLAIVKSIVNSMNGEYGVESEYGVGSEFWVVLQVKYNNKEPLNKDFMENRTVQNIASEDASFMAPDAMVLAVDDNQSNLTIVKLFLKQNGIIPDICSSGERAIELCKEKKYDLILLDHMMPDPDGIETLHTIRSEKTSLNSDTKAVVLTANAVAGSRQMYMDEGFDDYLTKPLDYKILEKTIRSMIPKEKIIENVEKSLEEAEANQSTLKGRLSKVEGFDYEKALVHCAGDEGLLKEIIGDIVKECPVCSERMKKSIEENDLATYTIDAHSIKGEMATIGIKNFSERAKKHEFAAKDNDMGFINKDFEGFINEYARICKELLEAID